MMLRYAIFLSSLLLSLQIQAFPCYVTVMKDKCWDKYEVKVYVKDVLKDERETTVLLPVGKSWARETFECEPKEELSFVAEFSPPIWKGEENKKYAGAHHWFLPEQVSEKARAWNVNICYPKDFSSVPLPPGDLTKCGCDKTGIPDIPPHK